MRSRGCLLGASAGAGVHHWRSPGVDGGDDLLGVDALQVGAGGCEVRVAELALDQRQRDSLVHQLDCVGVAQLMGREAAPDSRLERELAQLDPRSGLRTTRVPGSVRRSRKTAPRPAAAGGRQPWPDRCPCPGVHADLAAAVVLAVPDQD